MDHGKILALDTPATLKQSTGADTIVTVKVSADGEKLALAPQAGHRGHPEHAGRGEYGDRPREGSDRLVPRVVNVAEASQIEIIDFTVAELHARNRVHQPHR